MTSRAFQGNNIATFRAPASCENLSQINRIRDAMNIQKASRRSGVSEEDVDWHDDEKDDHLSRAVRESEYKTNYSYAAARARAMSDKTQ